MISLLASLRAPPVVGRFYMVPTVRYMLRRVVRDWPVIGPRHEDARDLDFPHLHYHLDSRFLTKAELESIRIWGKDDAYSVASSVVTEPVGIETDSGCLIEYGRLPSRTTLQKRRCARLHLPFPDSGREQIKRRVGSDRIGDRYGPIAEPIRKADGRILCPHRKVDLSQFTPDADGIVTCPLHGLKVRCVTND